MVPVVTVVAADHGAPIVGLVAAGTDPDLVSPLVSDLGWGWGGGNQRGVEKNEIPKRAL